RGDRRLQEDPGAPQGLPGGGVDPGGIPGEVNLFPDLDLLDRQLCPARLQDAQRRGHDLGADAVAPRGGEGSRGPHGGATYHRRAMTLDDGIRELTSRLRTKPRTTVVTGAGVSAASGVPTFRGLGGFWKNF